LFNASLTKIKLKKMQELITKMKINMNSVTFATNNSMTGGGGGGSGQNNTTHTNGNGSNLTSFGRVNQVVTNSSNNPSFPATSNYSLINRNIPAINGFNGHNHHHQSHYHNFHAGNNELQSRHLNNNNFINSTPI
jgi:hypothetical protein